MAARAGASASEAAIAVNAIQHFYSDDQQSLLEVLEDYFTLNTEHDSDLSDENEDSGTTVTGKYTTLH